MIEQKFSSCLTRINSWFKFSHLQITNLQNTYEWNNWKFIDPLYYDCTVYNMEVEIKKAQSKLISNVLDEVSLLFLSLFLNLCVFQPSIFYLTRVFVSYKTELLAKNKLKSWACKIIMIFFWSWLNIDTHQLSLWKTLEIFYKTDMKDKVSLSLLHLFFILPLIRLELINTQMNS